MLPAEIEERTIRAFFIPEKRNRAVQLLGNPKRRKKLLESLNHCSDFDQRFTTSIRNSKNPVDILSKLGAPADCYLISSEPKLDGTVLSLSDAIFKIESACWGTLVSCIPGRLAYYYGESGEQRLALVHDAQ